MGYPPLPQNPVSTGMTGHESDHDNIAAALAALETAVPYPPGGTTEYLRADGTWDVPPGEVASVFGRTGAVTATSGDYTVGEVTGAAPLASPALTGTPTAPTASPLTDNTQVATTAYTDAAVSAAAPSSGTPLATTKGGTGVSASSNAALLDDLGALDASENLGDLASASTARTNLGLGSAATVSTPVSIANGGTGTATGAPQNEVFAGPTSGTGAPSFRALVAADVPILNQNTTGSAASFTGSLTGDVTGTQGATSVGKVQGVAVTSAQATLLSQLNNATTRSATATVLAGEQTVFTGSTASQTLTLPASPQASTVNTVLNLASVSVTLAAGAGGSIDSFGTSGSLTLAPNALVQLVYIGSTWYVIDTNNAGNLVGTLPVANGGTGAATAAQNAVFAGPASGGSGAPSYRALAAGDLPAATTSAQGAVEFDTTTPAATSTAGATGSAATVPRRDHVHAQTYGGVFGDGSDGSVTFDGTTTILGMAPVSDVYTLTRDIFCTSVTINSAATIITNGWRIFCTGTVTISGTVQANGNSATSGTNEHTAAAGTGTGTLGGGRPGSAGVATGTAATATASAGVATGAPGGGGNGSTGTGGASAGAAPSTGVGWLRTPFAVLATAIFNSSGVNRVDGGGGGSGGGGDGTNFGGGGGSGGGVVTINAWAVVNNGTISAAGGAGGTPTTVATNAGCGGGGGGAGGLILLYTLSAVTGSGTTSVAGGAGGTKATNGSGSAANGSSGASGTYLNIVVA